MSIAKPLIWAMLLLSCFNSIAQDTKVLPHAVVYRTRHNYKHLVPVTLSDDGKRIVSYPGIADIGTGQRPSQLANGYLLDNSGYINKHVAFLKLSYKQYNELKEIPTLKEMYKMLADKSPLTELYDCGLIRATTITKLNALIRKHRLKNACNKIN